MKKKLSSVVLSSLRPREVPYYVADEQQVGLRVRVAINGTLTWNLAYRIRGEPKTKSLSLGHCDPSARSGLGLAEARDRAAQILKAARQGRDLPAEEDKARRAVKDRLTVRELVNRYANNIKSPHRKGGALRTAADIERRLRRALSQKLDAEADGLARADVSELLEDVADGRAREAEKRRQVIGAMYRWGVAKGYVNVDPTAGTESYGRGDPRDRALSAEELRLLWTWLEEGADDMPLDCIRALQLQLCLGSRIGEIAGITAAEVENLGGKLAWALPAARSKNKQGRLTPLLGTARQIVERALERRKRGPLFRAVLSDRALTSSDVGNALKHRKLPCAHFTSHDLRRTVVSFMDQLGLSLDTIAVVVGHQRGSKATRTLVRHYSRARLDDRVEAALTAWDAHFQEIREGRIEGLADNFVRPTR